METSCTISCCITALATSAFAFVSCNGSRVLEYVYNMCIKLRKKQCWCYRSSASVEKSYFINQRATI